MSLSSSDPEKVLRVHQMVFRGHQILSSRTGNQVPVVMPQHHHLKNFNAGCPNTKITLMTHISLQAC